jgi:endonuclease/exonuclease/phosphatase family metal-dependent hydrolase
MGFFVFAVLSFSSPAEHTLSNFLRASKRLLRRELCLIALLAVSACGGAHSLAALSNVPTTSFPVSWLSPTLSRDGAALARWRAAVGSPVIKLDLSTREHSSGVDAVTVVSWNVALDEGNVVRLVRDLQQHDPGRPIVLLLQEAFRSGDDVPGALKHLAFASHLGRSNHEREVDDVARALGFALYYVPSMRNGPGAEDRGNAVLSSLPLSDLTAIELPFENQRRVAVAATIHGETTSGEAWTLRLASVHLDNLVGARNGWIATEYGRARQARGLREALDGKEPLILAGDFNTWFGFSDLAYVETARAFPQTHVSDRRKTFRGLLRLDHVFYRLGAGWSADVRRGESALGSDHYPLITTIALR